jgi:DNA mismatch repair protein MutS
MLFRIDEQTLKDLNVFDASDGTPLIKLFSSVKTSGGKHKLQEMMKSPLIDIELLTQRKDAIKYFHDHNFALGLEQINFELIEIYLSNRDERPKVNLIDSFLYYVKHRATSNYYIKFSGIKNTALFCAFLKNLINGRLSNKLPSKLNCIYEEIETILKQEVFLKLLNLSPAKVRFNQLASLDLNLRFKDRDKLMRLLQIAYELDVYQNVALLAKNRGFGFATYIASPSVKLEFDGIFHPKIDNPVKNNLSLREEKNIIFLSGSNMSGKSSFLNHLVYVFIFPRLDFLCPLIQ